MSNCVPLAYQATLWMSGSLCGFSPRSSVGMKSHHKFKKKVFGWALRALSALTHHVKSDDPDWDTDKMQYPITGNDGMVAASSCALYKANGGRMPYRDDPVQPYYAFYGNHADGTCRWGDYEGNTRQQSCKWVTNMATIALKLRSEFVNAAPEESMLARSIRLEKEKAENRRKTAAAVAAAAAKPPPGTLSP